MPLVSSPQASVWRSEQAGQVVSLQQEMASLQHEVASLRMKRQVAAEGRGRAEAAAVVELHTMAQDRQGRRQEQEHDLNQGVAEDQAGVQLQAKSATPKITPPNAPPPDRTNASPRRPESTASVAAPTVPGMSPSRMLAKQPGVAATPTSLAFGDQSEGGLQIAHAHVAAEVAWDAAMAAQDRLAKLEIRYSRDTAQRLSPLPETPRAATQCFSPQPAQRLLSPQPKTPPPQASTHTGQRHRQSAPGQQVAQQQAPATPMGEHRPPPNQSRKGCQVQRVRARREAEVWARMHGVLVGPFSQHDVGSPGKMPVAESSGAFRTPELDQPQAYIDQASTCGQQESEEISGAFGTPKLDQLQAFLDQASAATSGAFRTPELDQLQDFIDQASTRGQQESKEISGAFGTPKLDQLQAFLDQASAAASGAFNTPELDHLQVFLDQASTRGQQGGEVTRARMTV